MSRRAGFTLVEVVVAAVILSSALVAALATYGTELRTLARAQEVAIAVELAEDRLAAVELFAAERLPNLPDSLRRGAFADPFGAYRWQTEAAVVSGHELAEVSITVFWEGGSRTLTGVLPLPALRRATP